MVSTRHLVPVVGVANTIRVPRWLISQRGLRSSYCASVRSIATAPPHSARECQNLVGMQFDQLRPGLPARLSFETNARIPRALFAVFEPVPHPPVAMRQPD